jgi:6-phosphogluconate dehydrogenase
MQSDQYTLGMVGLGTMGRSLLLNMADHGFTVAGYDKDAEKVSSLEKEATPGTKVKGFTVLPEFIQSLSKPRAIMLLVPAGTIVDSAIADIVPLLDKGDLIIDGGNSHFSDTNRRAVELQGKGIHFFGMGVSGGEEGARKGPSMMPGGDQQAYKVVQPIFEAIAAKVKGEPCVTYIGPTSAGHFVKMVHNGIEYGLMQLIAETYEYMQKGLNLSGDQIHSIFKTWNEGKLHSFLIEITRDIFAFKEPGADHLLVNDIQDIARSKGTGKWTSQVAMDLQLPIPTIDTAVSMRDLSKYKSIRIEASKQYTSAPVALTASQEASITALEDALYFSTVVAYAQGMHLLEQASKEFGYQLKMDEIALIWRGGCIIRSAFLEDIYQAYKKNKTLAHLLLDPTIAAHVQKATAGMRQIVSTATAQGVAIPAHTASLSYFDALRSERMPLNLVQAQRDYFGAHTYERIDKEGVFHTQWFKK